MDFVSVDSASVSAQAKAAFRRCSYLDCPNAGKHMCTRCEATFYCGKECQKAHWKRHKAVCVPPGQGQASTMNRAVFGSINSSRPPTAGHKKTMKAAMADLKKLKREDAEHFCSQCGAPAICLNNDTSNPLMGVAQFVCKKKHQTAATDTCMGLEQECNCNVEMARMEVTDLRLNEISPLPPTPRALFIGGFRRGVAESFYVRKVSQELSTLNIPFNSINAMNDGSNVEAALKSGKYTKIIVVHFEDRQAVEMEMFETFGFMPRLAQWVKNGGKFILHGEGKLASILLQILTEKPWHFCGDFYRRCTQRLNRSCCCIPIDAFARKYSMKSAMLCGVDPENQLYRPKEGTRCVSDVPGFGNRPVATFRTAISVCPLGSGLVCHVGDVNAEEATVAFMATV